MFGIIAVWLLAFVFGGVLGAPAGMRSGSTRNRPAMILGALFALAFVTVAAGFGVYAADCPDCTLSSGDDTRSTLFVFYLYFYSIALICALAGLLAGSALGARLRRYVKTR